MGIHQNPKEREKATLTALIRYTQFLIHEGCYIGAMDYFSSQFGGEAIRPKEWPPLKRNLPDSPTKMAFGIGGDYGQYVTGEMTSDQLERLKTFFKAEIRGNSWGRVLFYLIMGGYPNKQGVNASPLPKFLHPAHCILPGCINIKSYRRRMFCADCDNKTWYGTNKSRGVQKLLERALIIAYDYPWSAEMETFTIGEQFQALWEGYIELCRYFYNPDKNYVPAAKWITPLLDSVKGSNVEKETFKSDQVDTMALLCLLPDEVPEFHSDFSLGGGPVFPHQKATPVLNIQNYSGGSTQFVNPLDRIATFSDREKDLGRAKRLGGAVYLPANVFKPDAIRRKSPTSQDSISSLFHSVRPDGQPADDTCHNYKLISCYQNRDDKPVTMIEKSDPEDYILLKDLERYLKPKK